MEIKGCIVFGVNVNLSLTISNKEHINYRGDKKKHTKKIPPYCQPIFQLCIPGTFFLLTSPFSDIYDCVTKAFSYVGIRDAHIN